MGDRSVDITVIYVYKLITKALNDSRYDPNSPSPDGNGPPQISWPKPTFSPSELSPHTYLPRARVLEGSSPLALTLLHIKPLRMGGRELKEF